MKQYCRYCAHAIEGDGVYCNLLEKVISESNAKRQNHCKSFDFIEIDVFDPEHIYKPKTKKDKKFEQLSLFKEK